MNQISLDSPLRNKVPGLLLLAILGSLMAVTSLSNDIYLPAMPVMAADLHGNIELTFTSFLVGFAVAQLVWGPISDHLGRKIPLAIGLILFVIGSAGCALSQDITQIVFWRVFQAIGACTGPMLARAMVRDLYSRVQAAQMLSTLTIIMAIAPIVGPLLGGQIIRVTSWHTIFWLLTVIGTLMFVSLRWLPETLAPERRAPASLRTAFGNYRQLVGNWTFMRYTLGLTFFYVAEFAFIAGSPFVYIEYFKVPTQYYGWLFADNILGVMALSFVNRALVQRYSLDTLLRYSFLIATLSALILVTGVGFHWGGLWLIVITVFGFFSMNGIIAASSTAAALDGVPEIAGSASALIGSLQFGSGIISSLMLAAFSQGTPWTMAWIIAVATLLGAGIVFSGGSRTEQNRQKR